MKNWKFLINRLMVFIGMIGSFIGATFGYTKIIISLTNEYIFLALLGFEFLILCLFGLVFLLVLVDFIKDNKRGRKD